MCEGCTFTEPVIGKVVTTGDGAAQSKLDKISAYLDTVLWPYEIPSPDYIREIIEGIA